MEPGLAVRARGVTRTFTRGDVHTPVLRGVDLDVPDGAFAVVVGPSGCGKSTLLGLVGGLDVVDGGELTVAGVRLDRASTAAREAFRRASVGYVFQHFQLLPTLTALENVEVVLEPLGLPRREQRDRAATALDALGLGGKNDRFPAELSGGEQQRVAIARALAKRPRVVVADEPTGSLDRANGAEVIAQMHRQQRATGATFLVATHDPAVMDASSLVFAMQDGLVERR